MKEDEENEIKRKFRFPKKHEHLVFLVDGKPMELPPPLKRYIENRFGNKKSNYKIIRKVSDKEDS